MSYIGNTAPPSANLGFSLLNDDGTTNLYLDTSNTLTLLLENGTNASLTFPAGGSAYLTLDLGGLADPEEIAALRCGNDSWTVSAQQGSLQLAPSADVLIRAGGTLIVTLDGLTISGSPTIAKVNVTVMPSTGQAQVCSTCVAVLRAATPGTPTLPLSVALSTSQVFLSTKSSRPNAVGLSLINQTASAVATGTDSQFLLAFVYGSGAADLTTATLGGTIDVSILQQPAGQKQSWKPVPDTISNNPIWEITPSMPDAFGTQENAIVLLSLANMVTNTLAGTTDVYVAYSGLPGYSDASFRLPLQKVPQVAISSFTASPTTVDGTQLPAAVTLSYTVSNATYVSIVNAGYSTPVAQSPFTTKVPVSIDGATEFTLIASNATTGQTVVQSLDVTATPGPYDALPVGAIVMWSGTTVPEGWAICDGTTGPNGVATPNLVAQFIQGADPTGANAGVGQSGGPDTHVHLFTASLQGTTQPAGAHHHTVAVTRYKTGIASGYDTDLWPLTTKNNTKSNPAFPTSSVAAHTHSFGASGSGTTATQTGSLMRPAWYALYFIMKCY